MLKWCAYHYTLRKDVCQRHSRACDRDCVKPCFAAGRALGSGLEETTAALEACSCRNAVHASLANWLQCLPEPKPAVWSLPCVRHYAACQGGVAEDTTGIMPEPWACQPGISVTMSAEPSASSGAVCGILQRAEALGAELEETRAALKDAQERAQAGAAAAHARERRLRVRRIAGVRCLSFDICKASPVSVFECAHTLLRFRYQDAAQVRIEALERGCDSACGASAEREAAMRAAAAALPSSIPHALLCFI